MSVNKKRIGIIVGTIRDDGPDLSFSSRRKSSLVAQWVFDQAHTEEFIREYSPGYANTEDVEFVIIDIAKYWPLLDTNVIAKWRNTIEALDAYIIISAEYNHSFPGTLKVALDYFSDKDTEERKAAFRHKPVGIVGLGFGASGARSVQQLKIVMSALGSWVVQDSMLVSLYADTADNNMNMRTHLHRTVLSRMLQEMLLLLK